ncbi:MAG: LysR family transcriptional regulator [Alphaproteobacteria bacterium]|nr:LysR family transcriptional regulator [Alphaproteobacteria bacterium]OJV46989.1 MAG: hypothetical protein BGO28_06595 [Alphaproteobacteria bacterium 43-37]
MEIELLRTFCAVCQFGSMTKASEFASLTPSGVQAQIKQLEGLLNTKLFIGHAQGVQLTGEGEALLLDAQELIAHHDRVITNVKGVRDTLEGELKVITTKSGAIWVTPFIREFQEKYPNIALNLVADEERSLLFSSQLSGITVGLAGFSPPKKTSLIWSPLLEYRWVPFAHPEYLNERGAPQTIEDLDHHDIIAYKWSPEHNYLNDCQTNGLLYLGREKDNRRKPIAKTDDIIICVLMLRQKMGIGLIPPFFQHGTELVPVLENFFPNNDSLVQKLYFIYPQELKENSRVQAFNAFVKEKAKEQGQLLKD